jgi:hypothetical protein
MDSYRQDWEARRTRLWLVHNDGSYGQQDLYDLGGGQYCYPGGAQHIRAGVGTTIRTFDTEAAALRDARQISRDHANRALKRASAATQRLIELGEE